MQDQQCEINYKNYDEWDQQYLSRYLQCIFVFLFFVFAFSENLYLSIVVLPFWNPIIVDFVIFRIFFKSTKTRHIKKIRGHSQQYINQNLQIGEPYNILVNSKS